MMTDSLTKQMVSHVAAGNMFYRIADKLCDSKAGIDIYIYIYIIVKYNNIIIIKY